MGSKVVSKTVRKLVTILYKLCKIKAEKPSKKGEGKNYHQYEHDAVYVPAVTKYLYEA